MTEAAVPPPPIKPLRSRVVDWVLWGALAVLLIISFGPADIGKLPLLFENSENMRQFGREFLRPDFTQWRLYISMMWLTIQIAIWGTVIAVVLAIPFGLLAARNIAPPWVVQPVRRLMDVLRSVNELVMGTVFLVAVGLGPFAGVMALALHTTGVLAKLFSEAVEAIDPQPVEGIRATGASPAEEVVWGVLPQVAPLWVSYALYRFESNARSATVLGLIGAGGIGQVLFESINGFAYRDTAAIALIIVVAVSFIDLLSQGIRKRLL
ncbi:MAG TPA: phosphonate ABC transporter, permease protein PhnE [Caulobacteraceae bacterium]|jgi:phosphonate transport system permease protein